MSTAEKSLPGGIVVSSVIPNMLLDISRIFSSNNSFKQQLNPDNLENSLVIYKFIIVSKEYGGRSFILSKWHITM